MIKGILLFFLAIFIHEIFAAENLINVGSEELFFRYRYGSKIITSHTAKIDSSNGATFLPSFSFKRPKEERIKVVFSPLITYRGSEENSSMNNFDVGEAYLNLKLNLLKEIDFKIGKQSIQFKDGNFFSSNKDLLKPTFYDALNIKISPFKIWNQSFIMLNKRNHEVSSISAPKEQAVGTYGELILKNINLDLYYLYHKNNNRINLIKQYAIRDGLYKNAQFYGLNFSHFFNFLIPISYQVELIEINFNKEEGHREHPEIYQGKGNFVDFKLNFDLHNQVNFLKRLETTFHYFLATRFYVNSFGNKGQSLGIARKFGRQNIEGFGLKERIDLNDQLAFRIEYYNYWQQTEKFPIYKPNGEQYVSNELSGTNKKLGKEVGGAIDYHPFKNLSISLNLFHFTPEGNLKNYFGTDKEWGGIGEVNLSL